MAKWQSAGVAVGGVAVGGAVGMCCTRERRQGRNSGGGWCWSQVFVVLSDDAVGCWVLEQPW